MTLVAPDLKAEEPLSGELRRLPTIVRRAKLKPCGVAIERCPPEREAIVSIPSRRSRGSYPRVGVKRPGELKRRRAAWEAGLEPARRSELEILSRLQADTPPDLARR